jgi:DNA-binding transcriptional LysR family regulator
MELRQLQHFLALAEHRTFRAAAESVHLTQQAVSKSILQLEARLGVQLFERKGRTVTLTASGELLLPHARAVNAELRQFDDRLDAHRGTRSARVRVGASPTLLADVVPEALRLLRESHPRVALDVQSGSWDLLVPRLLRGELDVVLATEPVGPVDELVAVEPLCMEYNVIVAAQGHALAGTRPTPRQLLRNPWIALTNFPRADDDLRRYFAAAKLRPPLARMRTESNAFALAWVERTDFLCALPSRAAARDLARGRVVALDVELTTTAWNLVAGWRREGTQAAATLAFLQFLRSVVRASSRA